MDLINIWNYYYPNNLRNILVELNIKREELLISQLADLLVNDKHVAVGAASPIPGAAALLAKEEAKIKNKRLRVTILHSNK